MNKNKDDGADKPSNDIKDLRSLKQINKLKLDYDSPRLQKACFNLGVTVEELKMQDRATFEEKGVAKDVVDLRYKHFKSRLLDTVNRVLQQRRDIKINDHKEAMMEFSRTVNGPAHTFGGSPKKPKNNFDLKPVHRRAGSVEMMPSIIHHPSRQMLPIKNWKKESSVRNSLQRVRERHAQLLVDDDQIGRAKVEQYDKKITQINKHKNQTSKYQIDRVKKKEKRRVEALQRFHQIEKARQKKLNQEHKQFIEKMKKKEDLRREKEQETYHRLKNQEIQFNQKRGQMLKNKAEQEIMEDQYVEQALNSLNDKMDQSFNMKQKSIEHATDTARKSNLNVSFKNINFKKSMEQHEEEVIKSHYKKEKKVAKKLERMYKS
jgi:hypothetical protein